MSSYFAGAVSSITKSLGFGQHDQTGKRRLLAVRLGSAQEITGVVVRRKGKIKCLPVEVLSGRQECDQLLLLPEAVGARELDAIQLVAPAAGEAAASTSDATVAHVGSESIAAPPDKSERSNSPDMTLGADLQASPSAASHPEAEAAGMATAATAAAPTSDATVAHVGSESIAAPPDKPERSGSPGMTLGADLQVSPSAASHPEAEAAGMATAATAAEPLDAEPASQIEASASASASEMTTPDVGAVARSESATPQGVADPGTPSATVPEQPAATRRSEQDTAPDNEARAGQDANTASSEGSSAQAATDTDAPSPTRTISGPTAIVPPTSVQEREDVRPSRSSSAGLFPCFLARFSNRVVRLAFTALHATVLSSPCSAILSK
jgi:hypothetical protein